MTRQRGKIKPKPADTRAAIYLRQSLDAEGDTLAVQRQARACRDLVRARGWTEVATYTDNSVSASGRRVRPEFNRMLTAAAAGEFDIVVAMHLDRLTRTLRDYQVLLDLHEEHGVAITTVSGDLDLSTDMGQTVAGLLAVVANGEIKRKGARQKAAAAQRAEKGLPAPGPRPFGYEPDMTTVRPSEAAHISAAYSSLLAGVSASQIARDLNAAGMTTAKGGKPYRHSSVRQMLVNPRYAGLRAHKGDVVGPAVWNGIVTEDVWQAAQAILADDGRRTNKGTGLRANLLTGVAVCGVCGAGVHVAYRDHDRATGYRRRVYRCAASAHLQRSADAVEEFVVDVILKRLAARDAAELLVDDTAPDVPMLRRELQALRKREEKLADGYADGDLTLAQVRRATERLKARRAELESQMAHTDRAPILGPLVGAEDPRATWDALSLAKRQKVITTLATITLHRGRPGGRRPGEGPVPDGSVEIRWVM